MLLSSLDLPKNHFQTLEEDPFLLNIDAQVSSFLLYVLSMKEIFPNYSSTACEGYPPYSSLQGEVFSFLIQLTHHEIDIPSLLQLGLERG